MKLYEVLNPPPIADAPRIGKRRLKRKKHPIKPIVVNDKPIDKPE